MTNPFYEPIPEACLLNIWKILSRTPRHCKWLLTQRPEKIRDFFEKTAQTILLNLWIGASVDHEKTVSRIEAIRQIPAAIRLISFEPLIWQCQKAEFCLHPWGSYGADSIKRSRKENGNRFRGKEWKEIPKSAYDSVMKVSQKWEKMKKDAL